MFRISIIRYSSDVLVWIRAYCQKHWTTQEILLICFIYYGDFDLSVFSDSQTRTQQNSDSHLHRILRVCHTLIQKEICIYCYLLLHSPQNGMKGNDMVRGGGILDVLDPSIGILSTVDASGYNQCSKSRGSICTVDISKPGYNVSWLPLEQSLWITVRTCGWLWGFLMHCMVSPTIISSFKYN